MRIPGSAGIGSVLLVLATVTSPAADAGELPVRPGAPTAAVASAGYLDLTYPFDDKTIYWPTDQPLVVESEVAAPPSGENPAGCYSAASRFCTAEHGGTHLDAPAHAAPGHWTVDQIPLTSLIGHAVVVDITDKARRNPDAQLEPADLLRWEALHGPLPAGAILLIRTGWGRYWADQRRFWGTDRPGDLKNLHFPGIAPAAAQWLVANRRLKAVGIDTPSVDYGQSQGFQTHRLLAEKNLPVLENIAELQRLPTSGATLYILPIKIRGAGGAPCRIVAQLPPPGQPPSPPPGPPASAPGNSH